MNEDIKMIAFGPVPSRRLGQSLGINNIPPKVCTYSCIYCQLGRTLKMQTERRTFYNPEKILESVEKQVKEARNKEEPIDYLTFVPDGEPTLDIHLGKEIELLGRLGFKIAVISNASLLWREDVQNELFKAEWVSLKVDAVTPGLWHKVNRPYKTLKLDKVLDGIADFSRNFKGILATETMLVHGFNDSLEELERIADFIGELSPHKSYISIPTRPPAEEWVRSATESRINTAYQVFTERSINTEYLIGYEGNAFAFTGDVEEDVLSITSVHPMREDAVRELLAKADADWRIINKLKNEDKLVEMEYRDKKFYIRKLQIEKSKGSGKHE